jgi:hypothetical protein
MLDNYAMPSRAKTGMPGLGIQGRNALLVHQWNDVQGKGSAGLGFEDEVLPFLRCDDFFAGIRLDE